MERMGRIKDWNPRTWAKVESTRRERGGTKVRSGLRTEENRIEEETLGERSRRDHVECLIGQDFAHEALA